MLDDHHRLAQRLGLDGVHLTDGPRRLRDVRKTLGQDAIVGAFCGTSRHDGMTAAEIGADYVSFGPVSAGLLGDGTLAEPELFQWWSEMIEVPVVAEGGLTPDAIVGAFCGTSRHDGMTAAEIGADYVSFGPVSAGLLGDGTLAEPELFQWWSEMIEVPVVAEGGLTPDAIAAIAPFADFLCLGDEIWRHQDGPTAALRQLAARLS